MRRWIAVAAGLFGLLAYLRRRREGSRDEVEPADELRARLAEQREAPAASAEPDAAPEPEPEAEPDAVGERRQDVHNRARAAIDELG
jgi:hypothetical protein